MRVVLHSSGMGGALRSLKLASQLSRDLPDASLLAITDLAFIGHLELPANLDYLHVPATGDPSVEEGLMPRLRSGRTALALRSQIADGALESFDPDLVIVDRDPLGLEAELARPLERQRRRRPRARFLAVLPDVAGVPERVRSQWRDAGVYGALEEIYDATLVLGARDVFDAERAYALPAAVAQKLHYTGYLRHRVDPAAARAKVEREGIDADRPFVLVSAGSGRGGFPLLDAYLGFLESRPAGPPFQSHLLCGPFLPPSARRQLEARSEALPDVFLHRFHRNLDPYFHRADLLVSTFGYNTCCQILSFAAPAIVVPAGPACEEEMLRAEVLAGRGLVELIAPSELSSERLGGRVMQQLRQPTPRGRELPSLDGLENFAKRASEGLC